MLRSMFSGVSGMKNQQTKLDVIANNIANVSTTSFKSGRVLFQDVLSQTVGSASAPTPGRRGGINPSQVGMGMQVSSIDTITNQGIPSPTNSPYDCAVSGDGYFIISDGINQVYTRDGSFRLDTDFNLTTSNGYKVMGYAPMSISNNATDDVSGLKMPSGKTKWADVTQDTQLDLGTDDTDDVSKITINGITLNFHTAAAGASDVEGKDPDATKKEYNYYGIKTVKDVLARLNTNKDTNVTASLANGRLSITANPGSTNLEIDAGDGVFATTTGSKAFESDKKLAVGGLVGMSIPEINPNDPKGQDKISNFEIDQSGSIRGIYESGDVVLLGSIALSKFANPSGLTKLGGNNFSVSANSGSPNIGIAGMDGRGAVLQNSLELSNVDLAAQFTDMIQTSRAYQSNSRSITTSDEMLQELLNLKR